MNSSLRLVLLTVLAMLAFAGNSLLCRIALRDTAIDAATFTAVRIASGALMLAVILAARRIRPATGGSWWAAAMLFSYAAFFSYAYRDLSAATGALLLFGAFIPQFIDPTGDYVWQVILLGVAGGGTIG